MHAVFDDPAAMEGAQDPEVRVWDGIVLLHLDQPALCTSPANAVHQREGCCSSLLLPPLARPRSRAEAPNPSATCSWLLRVQYMKAGFEVFEDPSKLNNWRHKPPLYALLKKMLGQ